MSEAGSDELRRARREGEERQATEERFRRLEEGQRSLSAETARALSVGEELTERMSERDAAAQAMTEAAAKIAEKQMTQRELLKWTVGIVAGIVVPIVVAIIASHS